MGQLPSRVIRKISRRTPASSTTPHTESVFPERSDVSSWLIGATVDNEDDGESPEQQFMESILTVSRDEESAIEAALHHSLVHQRIVQYFNMALLAASTNGGQFSKENAQQMHAAMEGAPSHDEAAMVASVFRYLREDNTTTVRDVILALRTKTADRTLSRRSRAIWDALLLLAMHPLVWDKIGMVTMPPEDAEEWDRTWRTAVVMIEASVDL